MSAPPAPPALAPFDGNSYRKAVLVPLLAGGVVALDDPFKLIGVDPDCDDPQVLAARLVEVVGFWQRERNSPRYKGLVGELVKRRAELEGVLLDKDRRALARLRVQGTRRAQESARSARLDRLLKAVTARHSGVPRSRLVLLRRLAEREGMTAEAIAARFATVEVLEDGGGVEPLPEGVRHQVRVSLDEVALRGERGRSASLWAFLGLPASATAEELEARHADLVAGNLAGAHDREKTVHGDLLAHVRSVLMDPPSRAAYLAGLVEEVRERIGDRVLELAIVDGELWPADVEILVREALALGTGITQDQARAAVRESATSLGVAVTTGKAPDHVVCPSCQRQAEPGAAPVGAAPVTGVRSAFGGPGPVPQVSAGVQAQAQEEWRQLEREVGLHRPVHALGRAQRLVRLAPDVPGPAGRLPSQRVVELTRLVTEARSATERAVALPDVTAREQALYAVLEGAADCEEALTALGEVPVATPVGVVALLEGSTMRLSWTPPASSRAMTYTVVRVTRAAGGGRVEHPLGMTTRCEAVDADLPYAALVWHEVTASVGGRRSAPAVTEPQPVVPDVHSLRAAQAPDGVTLSWVAPPGSDVVVERRRQDDPDAPLRRTRARGSRWKDSDVERGAAYRYVVRVEAAVGGVVARTPGCTVDVRVADLTVAAPAAAAPAVAPRGDPPAAPDAVTLTITPVAPGVVVSWTAPPGVEVTVLAGEAPPGEPGTVVDLREVGQRVVGSAVGGGSAFEVDPGPAVVYTPVSTSGRRSVLGEPVRHVALGPVEEPEVSAGDGVPQRLRWRFPRGCGEALVVWRADRTPVDAADADGGEVVTAERLAADGGWSLPSTVPPSAAPQWLLLLPVAHLAGAPVLGPGTPVRLRGASA